jgi:hypothetical protein
MRLRIVFPIIRAGVWLTGGIFLLQMAATRDGAGADNFRFAAYLAFAMVFWNLLRAFFAARKIKNRDDETRGPEIPDH